MERLSCIEPGCGATFKNNANRVEHYRAQHQNLRSDPCPMCSLHGETKTFYSQSGLRTHYLNVHGLVLGSDADPLSSNQRESLPQVQLPLPQARLPSQPGGLFGRLERRSLSLNHGFPYYGPRNAFAFFRAREEGKEDDSGQSDSLNRASSSLIGVQHITRWCRGRGDPLCDRNDLRVTAASRFKLGPVRQRRIRTSAAHTLCEGHCTWRPGTATG